MPPPPAPHAVRVRPRYGEVDQMGVVYHAHYLVYFELGRTELMRELGADYAGIERRGLRLAVVEAGLRYLRPARYDEECLVETAVGEVGGARVRFDYVLRGPDGSVLATGFTRLGCLDRDNRPTRLPTDTRAALLRGRRGAPGPSEGP